MAVSVAKIIPLGSFEGASPGWVAAKAAMPMTGGPDELNKFPGDNSGGVTPVPIPNTEVKPSSADGTWRETAWESRSLPGLILCPTSKTSKWGFFMLSGHASMI